ncbi:MAG: HyaD/HybD family hydrogenase maturation endopeptidase [Nitrospinae bacterium]|nr:HyaD/HybD family hydrogenase maturation endopeptidase [Nitrospinota bacterium]
MNTASPRIIVLGVGNILLSDEGVGVRVAEKLLAEYSFPPNVQIYDGGTLGLNLLPFIEEADHLIVLDAVNGPGEPGSLYRYTAEDFTLAMPKKMSAHDIGLIECLAIAQINDELPKSVVIIGVKPEDIRSYKMELTETIGPKAEEMAKMALAEIESLGFRAEKKFSHNS